MQSPIDCVAAKKYVSLRCFQLPAAVSAAVIVDYLRGAHIFDPSLTIHVNYL